MIGFNKNIRIGDRMLGTDYPTYFIAEIVKKAPTAALEVHKNTS